MSSCKRVIARAKRPPSAAPPINLIIAQLGKALLATMLFTGKIDTVVFKRWLSHILLSELAQPSAIIVDNEAFINIQAPAS